MAALHEAETYKVVVDGCARIFRFRPDAFASQMGTLFLTSFRLRFVPRPCRCATLEQLGPPNWHSGGCETKGPVTPWGSFIQSWPPTTREANELLSGGNIEIKTDICSSHGNGAIVEDMRYAYDVPLFTIRKIHFSSREVRLVCRDGRTLEFELASEAEAEGVIRLLAAFAFPKDDICGAFAFQTRHRVGLGWDIFDPALDASRMLEPRSRIPLRMTTSPCETYPSIIWVPSEISDAEIAGSAAFRSMGRLPVPVWAHPKNGSLLVRSAQPLVGLLGNRSASDEKLIRTLCGPNYLLLDARSRAAALGNRAMGKGTESIERGYEGATELVFCDLGNIHHLKACATNLARSIENPVADASSHLQDIAAWLLNVSQLLRSSLRIVSAMDQAGVSTWTHCSDGWDRTAQMCALAQMMMEPEYRTRLGFAVVIEKNFASYGFKFRDRSRGVSTGQAAASSSSPSSSPTPLDPFRAGGVLENEEEEASPVLLLFIECVYQLLQQFPDRFDYGESFLLAVIDAYFSGRFGTFLCNSEKERLEKKVHLETRAVWDYVCTDDRFKNPNYTPYSGVLDAHCNPRLMKLFDGYWRRFDPCNPLPPMASCFF